MLFLTRIDSFHFCLISLFFFRGCLSQVGGQRFLRIHLFKRRPRRNRCFWQYLKVIYRISWATSVNWTGSTNGDTYKTVRLGELRRNGESWAIVELRGAQFLRPRFRRSEASLAVEFREGVTNVTELGGCSRFSTLPTLSSRAFKTFLVSSSSFSTILLRDSVSSVQTLETCWSAFLGHSEPIISSGGYQAPRDPWKTPQKNLHYNSCRRIPVWHTVT